MFDIYADADPEEMVTVGGQALSLRTAIRRYVAAREETRNTTGVVVGVVAREAGKIPGSLLPADMDILAELERFRWSSPASATCPAAAATEQVDAG